MWISEMDYIFHSFHTFSSIILKLLNFYLILNKSRNFHISHSIKLHNRYFDLDFYSNVSYTRLIGKFEDYEERNMK